MSHLTLTNRIAKLSANAKTAEIKSVEDYQNAMNPVFEAKADMGAWFGTQLELLEEAQRTLAAKFTEAMKKA